MSETFCPPGFGVVCTVHVVAAAAGEASRATAAATAVRVPGSHRLVMCPHSVPAAGAAARPRVLRPAVASGFLDQPGAAPAVTLTPVAVIGPAWSEARNAATFPTSASEVIRFSMVLPWSHPTS